MRSSMIPTATIELTETRATSLASEDGFFGRQRETDEILTLLARPDLACLTVVGSGGPARPG